MKVTELFEMAKRTTPADFYKMALAMYGAEKIKSVTMPEVKAVAVKNDVQIPPYVVKQKVGRGRFNLKPEGTKEEPKAAPAPKEEPKAAPAPKGSKELSDAELKNIVYDIVAGLKGMSRVYQTQDVEPEEYQGKKTWYGGVRDWGQWEVPEDEEDDGDYDWRVLTPEWKKKLRAFADQMDKKYPNARIIIQTGEKDWIDIQVKNR